LIVVIDYGLGNLRSVRRGLEKCGAEVEISHREREVRAAEGLVLPGVGAFDDGMRSLEPLEAAVKDSVDDGSPLLGVCLGMQMLFESSEEGGRDGLGLVQGRSIRFREGKVPHMGWNTLEGLQGPLFGGVEEGSYVYFVHSYYADAEGDAVSATSNYNGDFAAAVSEGNVFGTQFHPEKSGEIGLRILENFVEMV